MGSSLIGRGDDIGLDSGGGMMEYSLECCVRKSGCGTGKPFGAEGNWDRMDPAEELGNVDFVDVLLAVLLRFDLVRLRPREDASTLSDEETLPFATQSVRADQLQ